MGKGSGGGARWAFLLLAAGVLLAATAAAAEEAADGGGGVANGDSKGDKEAVRWCKKACEWQYGQDARRTHECKSECHKQHPHAGGDEEVVGNGAAMDIDTSGSGGARQCEAQCRRRHRGDPEPWQYAACLSRCHHGGADEEEHESGRGGEQCRERCEHRRGWEKQRCLMECRSREQEGGGSSCSCSGGRRGGGGDRCLCQCKEECERYHHDRESKQRCIEVCKRRQQQEGGGGRDADAADVDDMDSDRCQKMCQRRHPDDWMKQLRCVQMCKHGARDDAAADGEDDNRHGGGWCEKQCQRYRDHDMRQQCVRSCRGRGSWEAVAAAGAILEVV